MRTTQHEQHKHKAKAYTFSGSSERVATTRLCVLFKSQNSKTFSTQRSLKPCSHTTIGTNCFVFGVVGTCLAVTAIVHSHSATGARKHTTQQRKRKTKQ